MLGNTLKKYEKLLMEALQKWDNVVEGNTPEGAEPLSSLEFYSGEIAAYRKIIKDLKDECPNRNLQHSNPTIGWAKKQLDEAGIVFIHTNIRPDLSKVDGYEWGTCRMDRAEFDRRVTIINELIKKSGNGMSALADDDLLEELF